VNAHAGNPHQSDGVWLVARVKLRVGQLVSEHLQEAKLKAASACRDGHARTAGGFYPEAEANFHDWSSAKVGEESAGQSFDENGRRGNRPTASGAAAMETSQRPQAGAILRRAREPQERRREVSGPDEGRWAAEDNESFEQDRATKKLR